MRDERPRFTIRATCLPDARPFATHVSSRRDESNVPTDFPSTNASKNPSGDVWSRKVIPPIQRHAPLRWQTENDVPSNSTSTASPAFSLTHAYGHAPVSHHAFHAPVGLTSGFVQDVTGAGRISDNVAGDSVLALVLSGVPATASKFEAMSRPRQKIGSPGWFIKPSNHLPSSSRRTNSTRAPSGDTFAIALFEKSAT